jgi:hypothetical protein
VDNLFKFLIFTDDIIRDLTIALNSYLVVLKFILFSNINADKRTKVYLD